MNLLNKKTLESALLLVMMGILTSSLMHCSVPLEIRDISIQSPDLNKSKDGNYYGSFESKMVKAEVMVKIKDHTIEDIDLIKHETGLGKKSEVIIDSVLAYQTVELDAISGATASTKVILKSIENAINNSIKKQLKNN